MMSAIQFDPYMNTYLERILQWLGIYHIPVILLSATLPGDKRLALMQAYAGKKKCKNVLIKETTSYPLISWSDHERVQLIPIPYDEKKTGLFRLLERMKNNWKKKSAMY